MNERLVNTIAGRMSLRNPLRVSLEHLDRVMDLCEIGKDADPKEILSAINREYPTVSDFERDFPSLCYAIATGVGKTRLMGAFITYLHLEKNVNHFFVLAPNLTIYNKLIADFTPNTAKYVFKGIAEFAQEPPIIVTGDNYESGIGTRSGLSFGDVIINIFNVSKINTEVRGGASPRIKRLSEYIGQSYFDYLASLPDLVLIMDEAHRYRASAGIAAINELRPILGLELTATPFIEKGAKQDYFKNCIYTYQLGEAMEDGYVKEPAVVTRENFTASEFTDDQLERIKLEDGIRIHETTKVELETYARQAVKPLVKPFMLIIARDIEHAKSLQSLMESDEFFAGAYKGKVIQVHSTQTGEEKEENVQRLLEVERYDEPTEVVIHVNMLKEGWDVTNLYTIVPLRAANARNLVEQSIGRGLRLPYGKRTGVETVDRLNIIAHDRFQEIVDEANRKDSAIHVKSVFLTGNESSWVKPKTVVSAPTFTARVGMTRTGKESGAPDTPMFAKPDEQRVAQAAVLAMRKYESLPIVERLGDKKVKEELVADLESSYVASGQSELIPAERPNIREIVEKVVTEYIAGTISIPRIILVPKRSTGVSFSVFALDCGSIRYQPVERDLLLKELRTHKERRLSFNRVTITEERPEDYLVRALVDYDDISYDDHAEILYDLASQVVGHLRSYLRDEADILNVIVYNQKALAGYIHAQMLDHQDDVAVEYDVTVTKGFTEINSSAFTVPENQVEIDAHDTSFDKSKIKTLLFTGFRRSLYSVMKFDSDTERRFALFLDGNSDKWFKPALGQLGVYYKDGHAEKMYTPDFIAEFPDRILMVETKAKDEVATAEVQAKKNAAVQWCSYATKHTVANGGKPWTYLLIPHDEVKDDRTLKYYMMFA